MMIRVRTRSPFLPEHDGCGEGYGREKGIWAPVVTGCEASPALQSAQHDFDPVAAFVAAFGRRDLTESVSHGFEPAG